MSTRSHALRNTIFASIGIYTEYFLGMVAAIMTARHLGPGYYGIYGLFIWFAAVGVVVTNSGITTGVIKFVAELRGGGQQALIVPVLTYLRRVQVWHLVGVLGVGVILFFIAAGRWAPDLHGLEFALLVIAVGLRAPYMFNIAITKGFESFDATARIAMLGAPLNLALVALAVLLHGPLLWFVVVYATSSLAFFLASRHYATRLIRSMPESVPLPAALIHRVRRHLRLVSATVIIGFVIASGIEVLFLNLYNSAASAGYFKVAYQMAEGISLLVPGVFSAVLLPMMASALSQGHALAGRRFVAATNYLVLLAAPMVAFGVSFAGPLIGVLYGHAYAAAVPVFALFLTSFAISTVSQAATSLLVSADRQHTILTMTIAFGVLKIVLDVVLISHFGLAGATAAVVTGSLINSTIYMALAMRVGRVSLDSGRLLRIVLAAVLAAALALLTRLLPLLPLWHLLIGFVVVSATYLALTVLFRCWTKGDIKQLQGLHQQFAAGQPILVGRMLGWAALRAGPDP
jgi:O-antigen/teichoic acid export membrane protein